ncbi:furin-like protease 1, isoforms 1/1-X/2 isoform X3 [Tachypleus tridentatus]|uniref:furin-like protease 1, isoforms 1/1-X/2 isoform X3 n=1 Tax=Tachypleus tridentatus TaxID=6853 RepID=UPI003FD2DC83
MPMASNTAMLHSNTLPKLWLVLLFVHITFFRLSLAEIHENDIYTDQFVILVSGGPQVAQELARKHGFVYLGQVLKDYYHLRHHSIAKRSTEQSEFHHKRLREEKQIKWFAQQKLKWRVKRDFKPYQFTVAEKLNDPRWPQMWYLDPKASYDVNDDDSDPQPRYDLIDSNRHGTRCAGEVAAAHNNSICTVGVAFEASIGGVRMLDGEVTDAVEAHSLSLFNQYIDIYSASWGPDDDGKTVDGPGHLATLAFKEGIIKGRGGLGSIFVWASGNGGRDHDNCNCDGYTNSIWTLSISSTTENGQVPWYSEACSSTLATTYSSGSSGDKQIVTTDLHHTCTSSHTGTSASAPLAAGICSLALDANKKLSWRDMQHIVVRTARMANLRTPDWKINGVGRNVSHSFGFGLMDAAAMVKLARKWKPVPPQKTCTFHAHPMSKLIPAQSHVELSLTVHCDEIQYLEHVQAIITLSAIRRGDIHIYLTSPLGTRSTLVAQRSNDNSRSGFHKWPFMTVHNWGENPSGVWKLEVHNEGRYYAPVGLSHDMSGRASLREWTLVMYGTTHDPNGPLPTTTTTTTTKTPPVPAVKVFTSTTTKLPNNNVQYYPPTAKSPRLFYPIDSNSVETEDESALKDHSDGQNPDLSVVSHGTRENPVGGTTGDSDNSGNYATCVMRNSETFSVGWWFLFFISIKTSLLTQALQ